jgi:hypothetical protein
MRLLLCAAVAALVLTGCQSREQISQECAGYGLQPGTSAHQQCVQAVADSGPDHRQCMSYGVPFGSPEYVQCRMQADAAWEAQKAQRAAALQASFQHQPQPYQTVRGSILNGPQATACGWNAGQWVCRPSW